MWREGYGELYELKVCVEVMTDFWIQGFRSTEMVRVQRRREYWYDRIQGENAGNIIPKVCVDEV